MNVESSQNVPHPPSFVARSHPRHNQEGAIHAPIAQRYMGMQRENNRFGKFIQRQLKIDRAGGRG